MFFRPCWLPLILAVSGAALGAPRASLAAEPAAPAPPLDFARDVRPLLAARCWSCHGDHEPQAELQLHDRASAIRRLESGHQAIVPGEPAGSELLLRVTAADPAVRMPPRGEPLTASEVAVLRRWIEAGAPWPEHWSYRPLSRPPVPDAPVSDAADAAGDDWSQNAIDRFIRFEQGRRALRPAAPAPPRVLARRLFFVVTGLPPTPAQLEELLADQRPDAVERLIDRLLASPRTGERFARHWMDLVHFAETHGHDQDRPREHAWPYRDYLVKAFNSDLPYARFVQQQLAADELFPDQAELLPATGLLAAGPWDESSLRDIREDTLDREIARSIDRDDIVTTVMSTFASSTVHCARCHDHKFDPISQEDYYGLQAVFAATDKGNRPYDADPALAAQRRALLAARADLDAAPRDETLLLPEREARVAGWEAVIAEQALMWRVLTLDSWESAQGSKLELQEDGSLLSTGPRPEQDTYTLFAKVEGAPLTGLRLEVLADDRLPHRGPGRQENGNLHLSECQVTVAPVAQPGASRPVPLLRAQADFDQQGWTAAMALDGNPATAWGIYPRVGESHRVVFEFQEPLEAQSGILLSVQLAQLHGGGHLIGRPRLSVTSVTSPASVSAEALPEAILEVLRTPPAQRTVTQRCELVIYHERQLLDRQLAQLPPPQLVYCGSNQFQPDGSFKPAERPRLIHLLRRGDVQQPQQEIRPQALARIFPEGQRRFAEPLATDAARRAALAHWLTDPANMLTWRSIANRLWLWSFDRALVDTPNDFGAMGSAPTHPELLDWLALELQTQQGSLKALQRQLLTSATFQQSSRHHAEYAARDAENRYWWRMNRRRLDAEAIRDAALLIAGNLDLRMGGPSVKQFIQTPGIHVTPNVDYANFDVDDPANYRRSVYRFVFRTLPDPFMDALDCPDASQLTPQRTTSLTALQALALWNDKLLVRQGELLAERLQAAEPTIAGQIAQAFEVWLGRRPSPSEARQFAAYAADHGLANACRLLLNSNEFVFVD